MSKAKKPEELKMMESVAGVLLSIVGLLVAAVKKCGGGFADFHRLTTPEGADDVAAIAAIIARDAKKAANKFIIADIFQKGNAEVIIGWIGGNFQSWFLGKVEELTAVEIPNHHHDLKCDSLDAEILADLGGEAAAEVTLAGVYELLKFQPRGENGALLVTGFANIFYVRDKGGVLRAVDVYWSGVGWYVRARSVEDPDSWDAGNRVFSR